MLSNNQQQLDSSHEHHLSHILHGLQRVLHDMGVLDLFFQLRQLHHISNECSQMLRTEKLFRHTKCVNVFYGSFFLIRQLKSLQTDKISFF